MVKNCRLSLSDISEWFRSQRQPLKPNTCHFSLYSLLQPLTHFKIRFHSLQEKLSTLTNIEYIWEQNTFLFINVCRTRADCERICRQIYHHLQLAVKRGTRNLLSKQKLYFVSQIICVLPYVISKYISVPPLIFPYHNERYLWNKDNCTNLDKSMKRRMTFAFGVFCWCTLSPPPAQKSRHQKPRKSHESDQRAQIGRPCIPDLFSLNSFNQNCYFLAVQDSSIGDLFTHLLTQWVSEWHVLISQ